MPSEQRLVCVIIPAFNVCGVIERCLRSLQAQDHRDWIAIVVDDGSTDGTDEIIRRFASEDGRVRMIRGGHAGASAARNTGLDEAARLNPAYITFLDSDDYLEPDALDAFCRTAADTGAEIVHCKYYNEYVNGYRTELGDLFPPGTVLRREQFPRTVYWRMITGIQMNHACTKCYRAGLLEGIRFDTTMKTGEDLMFNIEVFSRAESYAYIARPLYHYIRDMAQGLTNSGLSGRVKLQCNWRISRRMLERLPAWGMDTPWIRLCAASRPLVLICSKSYRGILAKWARWKGGSAA